MAVAAGGVSVEGLKELAKAFRQLDDRTVISDLKDVNYRAALLVKDAAQGNASNAMESAAAARLKATKTANYAAIRLGGKPYDLGAEFGAIRGVPRSTARGVVTGWNFFRPWKGAGSEAGYFVYPAIRAKAPEIEETYGDEIEKITDKAMGKVS
jgi:hypothetical protein